jgi:anti-sigma B factor antagonist
LNGAFVSKTISDSILVVRRRDRRLSSAVDLFHLTDNGEEVRAAHIDSPKVPDVEMAVRASLEEGITRCIFNLENFVWIDSAGLGLLISILRHCRDGDGDLVLVKPNERVSMVFRVAQVEEILTVVDSEAEALALFRS